MRKVTLLSYLTLKNVTPTFLRNIWQLNSFFIVVKYLIWRIYFGKMNPIYFDCPSSHTEKAMAPHSSTLAWKIPWTEERGRLQSVGSLRVGHDWAASLSLSLSSHKNLDTECSLWMKLWFCFSPDSLQWASLVAHTVKNLPAIQETWVGKIPWRRAWQPTPVLLPGESPWTVEPGGYSTWGHKELDTTEPLNTAHYLQWPHFL